MKKVIFLVVGIFMLVTFLLISIKMKQDKNSIREFIVDGKSIPVCVYKLPAPLKIDVFYKGGIDLDAYQWIRPLMFHLNGFELTIPVNEWGKYNDVDWTPERCDKMMKRALKLKEEVEDKASPWNGVYSEIENIVWCKFGEIEMLCVILVGKKASGEDFGGSRYVMLQRVNGVWKRSLRGSTSDRADKIFKAVEMAMKEVKDKTLTVRSAKELK